MREGERNRRFPGTVAHKLWELTSQQGIGAVGRIRGTCPRYTQPASSALPIFFLCAAVIEKCRIAIDRTRLFSFYLILHC